MPHLLIAGETGSGKSVCINSLITSILFKASPDDVKMILIDPKVVELSGFKNIPHLLVPVVTDPKKASSALNWAVSEMTSRYKLFAEHGARDMSRFNSMQGGDKEQQLPRIVVIIDELAELMMAAPREVEDSICRLAQMARAAGIHLVVATQRPSVDVVTGIIKANMPSRIAFAVSSQVDSRTILDMGGAEKLLGRGDMLFFPVGAAKPHRVQGAFVSDEEIERVTSFIREKNGPLEQAPVEIPEEEMDSSSLGSDEELFWDAVKIFVDTGKASASMLQRRLRIGFTRAARLVDIMEERGIVSAPDVNKRREVLIDEHQLERLISGRSPA
jgi:S-DNA-T family DNA segregation ATPase FtsK/SpoIIIE